jgi:murein DD-endopeptidase MepM/ murein hydrolase activator NlpD
VSGSPDLAAQAAYAAGFRGPALLTAVEIAGAESGFGANPGPSATDDYGFWQINHPSHPSYGTAQLLSDPLYNAQATYAISSAGTNWTPWSTYNSGAFRNPSIVAAATAAVNRLAAGLGSAASSAIRAAFPLGAGKYTLTQGYKGNSGGHPGVDLAIAAGSPIYAAESGTIRSVGGDPGGFGSDYPVEVLADGTTLTYGHAEKSYVSAGQKVTAGQIIALVGSEGDSTGPHLHFQVNSPSGALEDPLAWLQAQGAGTVTASGGFTPAPAGFSAMGTLSSDTFPGGSADPLNWPGEAASSVQDAITGGIQALLGGITGGIQSILGGLFFLMLKGTAVAAGGALIVIGVASTVKKDVAIPALPSPGGGAGAAAGAGATGAASELPLAAAAV